jgi:hypothetical protein
MRSLSFILIFATLTLLPILQMITHAVSVVPISENRALAPRPSLTTAVAHFPRDVNTWFNDHFGLRPMLIRLKTQIDYSLFGASDRVLVGKDNWLFYRSTVNVEEPVIESLLGDGLEAKVVAGVRAFSDALEAAGIHTVLVVNMMSDRLYGDKLPQTAVRRPAHPKIDDLTDKLRALPNVRFIDSFAILTEAMQSQQVFYKTDFHWTDVGAFPVAKAMVDLMSKVEGHPQSAWRHPLEVEIKPVSGGIAAFMPLFLPPSEMAPTVKPTYSWPSGFKQSIDQGIFEFVTIANPSESGLLPSAVFVGDSFLDGMMRAGLTAAFVEIARVRWKNDTKLSAIAEAIPSNSHWLVVQFIEVNQTAMNAFADADDVAKAIDIVKRRKSAE